MARKGIACPECGAESRASHSNAVLFSEAGIVRGKECSEGHHFLSVEIPLVLDKNVTIWEVIGLLKRGLG